MNEREVAELRRRFKAEKSNISHIRGCYVNEKREIISQFDQSLAMMSQGESEQLLAILRDAAFKKEISHFSGNDYRDLGRIIMEV